MYYNFVIYINFLLFWIHSSIQDDKLEQRKANVETEIIYSKRHFDELIENFRTNEKQLQDLKNEINTDLSKEHQTIDQYMMCRSKIYQTIEQKILMGGITIRNSHIMNKCFTEEQSVYAKLENEYRNEACQLPVSNNIRDIKGIERLISKRFFYLKGFNKELFLHNILQTIHEQIDNELKKHKLEQRKANVQMAIINSKQDLDRRIANIRTNEKQLQDLKNEINTDLSKEHQTIDQYMMCRSKIYQTIEQKILMGGITIRSSHIMKECFTKEQSVYAELVDEYRNEACHFPTSNDIQGNHPLQYKFRKLDGLLREQYGKIRVYNIYLFSHNILQTIHEQIDIQSKQLIIP
ncbi:unnamed protein product [Schistosoma spindalis]|nr:unnamed protein product [Schistosoma spindale]